MTCSAPAFGGGVFRGSLAGPTQIPICFQPTCFGAAEGVFGQKQDGLATVGTANTAGVNPPEASVSCTCHCYFKHAASLEGRYIQFVFVGDRPCPEFGFVAGHEVNCGYEHIWQQHGSKFLASAAAGNMCCEASPGFGQLPAIGQQVALSY